MKELSQAGVTSTVGLIFEKNTFTHITNAYTEALRLVEAFMPESWGTGKLVILKGCVATGTNPGARTLTAGIVFYNGKIYLVPSASFTTTGSQIGIWTLTDVNAGSDESILTDGSNTHALVDNKFVFAAGLAGSGTFDETSTNIIRLGAWVSGTFTTIFDSVAPTGCSVSSTAVSYMVDSRTVHFKVKVSLTVTNATLINSGADMVFNTDLDFKTDFNGVPLPDVEDTGKFFINGLAFVGFVRVRYGNSGVIRLTSFAVGKNVVNGDTIDVYASGSYPLA